MYRLVVAALILIFGLASLAGGIWLAVLGGSWFYLLIGLVATVSGGLLLGRRPVGLSILALGLVLTLLWAIWEVGFDWWALVPRGSLLVVFGLLAILPPMVKMLHHQPRKHGSYGPHSAFLGVSLILAAGVGMYSMFQSPHDMPGTVARERMQAPVTEQVADTVPPGEWHAYGRTQAGQRYSPLEQITPDNVGRLEQVWEYRTGEVRSDDDAEETTYEATPLVINDRLYVCTPYGTVIALNPASGEELWRFDPRLQKPPKQTTQHMSCRGVSYFDAASTAEAADPGAAEVLPADLRVSMSSARATVEAAGVLQNVAAGRAERDAPNPVINRERDGFRTNLPHCQQRIYFSTPDGRLMNVSAETGEVCPGFGGEDGTVNLWANMPNITPGSVYATSPPVITERLVIVGGAVNDNVATTSPSGVIRAYDVHTGELVWNFDSKNPEALEPIPDGETYEPNSPNSWSISSYDPDLGLIYLPMGNESPDQFGGNRSENVERFSSTVLALNADTGEIAWLFQTVHHDIWDYDVPAQPSLVDLDLNGERTPALVVPTKHGDIFVLNRETGEPIIPVEEVPAPQGAVEGDFTAPTQPRSALNFTPPKLQGKDMWGVSLIDQLACRINFHRLRYEGSYTPPSTEGTLVYPGNFGTFNWGSVAVDPHRQLLFSMPVYLAFTSQLVPRENELDRTVTGEGEPVINENFGAPYAIKLSAFMSPVGLPCQQPPWGYVAAADLTTGEVLYQHINGTVRDLSPVPLPFEMGVPGIGGPIVTRGGVAFLSGTLDNYVRGYDLSNGEELWRARLPAGGQATPATYLGADGRQYLVVVAGGHGSTGTEAGDSVLAFALPD